MLGKKERLKKKIEAAYEHHREVAEWASHILAEIDGLDKETCRKLHRLAVE